MVSPLKTLDEVALRSFTQWVNAPFSISANVFKGEMHFLRFQLPNIGLRE